MWTTFMWSLLSYNTHYIIFDHKWLTFFLIFLSNSTRGPFPLYHSNCVCFTTLGIFNTYDRGAFALQRPVHFQLILRCQKTNLANRDSNRGPPMPWHSTLVLSATTAPHGQNIFDLKCQRFPEGRRTFEHLKHVILNVYVINKLKMHPL